MAGLALGIHVVVSVPNDGDGRDKPGHDDVVTEEHDTPIVQCDRRERGTWDALG
ncbi:hypothetical protein [Bradyrhizobium sp. HKCCYLS3013]|uniref:hypothetical protein n=1 Tax=Bradyrhizobium sp. HKCCYLS3013 TaxID=3420735 RepID=UPI003EB7C1C2